MEKFIYRIISQENPFNNTVDQCDPYSSFGVFCNANSFIEGILIIIGVVGLVAGSLYFVKKNQEVNADKHKERYRKYNQ
ncbi:MAG TPA: hypothetical protein DEP48_04765 [Persephonella sp.]|uniref:Uncharacterized protein n=1 Tax=Persephonella marina (strain DSM 14350 / EX-H1) TaxID=123214 RepID=C0QPZ0_PERMH|nr:MULTISPECIES: hypothetical protein [Persephonella]ACO04014.1 hypothetical protein PERMA_0948 [Persephonella marina EX-H1]HCB69649.1 hypothetical protein [Persephonella sp.]